MATIAVVKHETVPLLARIGFGARGVIYLLIGAFTAVAALRPAQPAHGLTGAMDAVARMPLGTFGIGAVGLGLACFALWLAIEGAARYTLGRGWRDRLMAVGMLGDAALYTVLVLLIVGVAIGWRSGGERELHSWIAWLFGQPLGRWVVGVVGGILIASGLGLIGWASTRDVEKNLDLPHDQKRLTRPISRLGVAGRGATLALIGFYVIAAAVDARPNEAHELGGLLQHLRHTAYGWVLLLLFALAFGASAFFDLLAAFFRRFTAPRN